MSEQTAEKITRCAIYTRVSTDMQAEKEFNSCDAQEARVRSFIQSQEGFKVAKVYSDPGYTGANTDRPSLNDMVRDIGTGLIDMVVTYKIDRLTRSPRDFYQLIEHFEKYGAGYISVTERFDTSTPAGRLLRNIMLTFAQFERELTSERIKDKVIQRVQKGLYSGGRPAFGYKTENAKLVLDPPRDGIVRRMFETYVKTRSIRGIRNMMWAEGIQSRTGKAMTDSFVWGILRKETYTGKIIHKGKAHPGQHPAIISEDLFDHVKKLMTGTPRRGPDFVPTLPFAGLVHCQDCGYVMSPAHADKKGKTGPKRYLYYRCSNLSRDGWASCKVKEINAERFHANLYQNLLRISQDADYLKTVSETAQAQTIPGGEVGLEPLQDGYDFSPKNLKKALEEVLTICARRTGMERILSVRRRIRRINYSSKTVSVEFFGGGGVANPEPDFARPPDGKGFLNQRPTTAASHAAPALDSPARQSESILLPPARKIEDPSRLTRLGSSMRCAPSDNGAGDGT